MASGSRIKIVESDSKFSSELAEAANKLVVVDFHATWCGPCRNIAPVYEQYAQKYENAVFLKVDVDVCQETAAAQGVTAMPTFNFYRNKAIIDSHRGADPAGLEAKIKKWYTGDAADEGDAPVKGHVDLGSSLNQKGCECLNGSDEHTLEHCLSDKGGYLESDCDEQLIIALEFNQSVKLHSLKMTGPSDKGPKQVKLFINQPRTIDFDSAESMEAIQSFSLTPEQLEGEDLLELRYVKFQNVQTLTIFVKDNQGEEETTQIDQLVIYGSPVNTTNMAEFKRVAGKKGESH